jgi:hypothetical protein
MMIASGLSLKHRARYGRLKYGKGMFGLSKQDMGVPSSSQQGSGIKKDAGPELAVMPRRALKFRF